MPNHDKDTLLEFTCFKLKTIDDGDLIKIDVQIVKDPHDLINGKKIRHDLFGSYEDQEKINYTAIDKKNNIGVTELWGRRQTQEDRVLFGALAEITNKFTKEEWQNVLNKTISLLESNIELKGFDSGSCLCANMIVGTTIYTANLGDSTTYLVMIDEQGNRVVHLLNKLHKPDDKQERKRIEAMGGYVARGRLNGVLAVSRAMGDTTLQGISHDADITQQQVLIPPRGHAFLITACDGMTENARMHENEIGKIVAENRHKSPADISSELAMKALAYDSYDNISVIVTPITATQPPRYAIVFDGHGDNKVSDYLYYHFIEILNNIVTSERSF